MYALTLTDSDPCLSLLHSVPVCCFFLLHPGCLQAIAGHRHKSRCYECPEHPSSLICPTSSAFKAMKATTLKKKKTVPWELIPKVKLLCDGIHAFKSLLSCEEIKVDTRIPKNNPLRV